MNHLTRCLPVALCFMNLGLARAELPLELGVFVPRLPFADNLARAEYAREVADAIAAATDQSIRGQAFAGTADLEGFATAGRLQLVLVDPAVVVESVLRLDVIAQGTGPEGAAPRLAVLGQPGPLGISSLAGRGIALTRVGQSEQALLSNLAFEGQLTLQVFFGSVTERPDAMAAAAWVRDGQAAATIGFAGLAPAAGLTTLAELERYPLPVLCVVRGSLDDAIVRKLENAMRGVGVTIQPTGLLQRLQAVTTDHVARVRRAATAPAGTAARQRAIWSPAPRMDLKETFPVIPRRRYTLEPPRDRIRLPDFEPIE